MREQDRAGWLELAKDREFQSIISTSVSILKPTTPSVGRARQYFWLLQMLRQFLNHLNASVPSRQPVQRQREADFVLRHGF